MIVDAFEEFTSSIQPKSAVLQQAYKFAEIHYANYSHPFGASYYLYACEAAAILQQIHADDETIAAGLLFHLPLLTGISLHEIQSNTNLNVRILIEEACGLDKIEWPIETLLFIQASKKNTNLRLHEIAEKQEQMKVLDRMFRMAINEPLIEKSKIEGNDQSPQFFQKQSKQLENLMRMFLVAATDVRALVIQLADRLQFLQRLLSCDKDLLEPEYCRLYAEATLQIYAPIADRLGIWALKSQLEDLSFQYLRPDKFKEIKDQLAVQEQEQENNIHQLIIPKLEEALAAFDIKATISGRAKHVYSIYRKMEAKHLTYEQLNDVLGVRIITETREECYKVQAILHALWTPFTIPYDGSAGRDWIIRPKENNYQSIHTTVLIDGKEVEIQLRTHQMHDIAENGPAAHWRYKTPKFYNKGIVTYPLKEKEQIWTDQLTELRQQLTNTNVELPPSFHNSVKKRIYVITPLGHVIDLIAGATPLDFAYRIHTNRGHAYNGAKVGGRIVRMDYRLQNGDIVELLPPRTSKKGPSTEWLSKSRDENGKSNYIYARTSQARSKIKQWFHANKQPIL